MLLQSWWQAQGLLRRQAHKADDANEGDGAGGAEGDGAGGAGGAGEKRPDPHHFMAGTLAKSSQSCGTKYSSPN